MKSVATYSRPLRRTILLPSLALFCGLVLAQIGLEKPAPSATISGPTLEESTKWITEKINSVGFTRMKVDQVTFSRIVGATSDTVSFISEFNGCQFKLIQRSVYAATQYFPVNTVDDITIVDFDQLSATSIDVVDRGMGDEVGNNEGFILLRAWTVGKQTVVSTQRRPQMDIYPDKKDWSISVYFRERELAERMKNAIQHTIKLCVQQKAQKKAAEPPRPKETF